MRVTLLIVLTLLLDSTWTPASISAEETVSISLKDAVAQALQNNLSLQLLREDVNSAEGANLAAAGKFDVLLNASLTAQDEETTPLYTGGATEEETGIWSVEASKLFSTGTTVSLGWNNNRYDSDLASLELNPSYTSGLSLGVTQPLLRGFGKEVQTADLRASAKQLEAATFQLDNQAADLAAQVKQAYWSLVFSWQDIEVKKLSLTLARKLLEETEAKIEAGRLAEVEIYQPQSEVSRREEELISAERAIGTAEDQLKLLLNTDKWYSTFQPTDQPSTEPIELDIPTIEKNVLENRPAVKAADLQTEAARINEQSAANAIKPDLSLIGSLGFTGTSDSYGDSLDNHLSDPDNQWQVGVTFSMPLGNKAAKGLYQQAKASHMQARTNAQLLRQQLRQTVRTTVRDVRLAIKALDATRKTSLATLKRLEAEEAKFASGRSTTLDVLTAQEAYSEALSQQNSTSITYANSLAELDRIQGLVTLSSSRPK